jgi:predicted NUDIX family NTP pyrophosphohydrolase
MRSNTIKVEWPRGSGRSKEFPEVDRAEWFRVDDARTRINSAQVPFLDHLVQMIKG